MKNKFFSVIILCISAFACLLLSSCNANNGNASNDESTFDIAASSDIYYLGDEAIALTVDGELPYGYSEKDISYIIENSDESATCTISQDGTLTFGGIGMATVRAKVGETLSKNAVNVSSKKR